jgi:hypothetical protein
MPPDFADDNFDYRAVLSIHLPFMNTKRHFVSTCGLSAFALMACIGASARADIGINFANSYNWQGSGYNDIANSTLAPTDSIGVVPMTGWRSSPDLAQYGQYMSGVPSIPLTDSNGVATGAMLTLNNGTALDGTQILDEPNIWDSTSGVDPVLTPMDKLYNSSVAPGGGRAAEFALQNIPYATYDLYVYLSFDIYQSGSIQLFENGSVSGAQTPLQYGAGMSYAPLNEYGGYPDSGYTEITSTDPTNPTATGNAGGYVEFTGLTGLDQTLDLLVNPASTNGGGGVSGFQIIDTSAVPEPSSIALLLAGLGMFGFLRRRR